MGSTSIVSADAISKNFGDVSGTSGCFRTYGSGSTTRGNGAVSLDFYNQLPGGGGDVYQQSASGSPYVSISAKSGYVTHLVESTHGNGAGTVLPLYEYNYDYR